MRIALGWRGGALVCALALPGSGVAGQGLGLDEIEARAAEARLDEARLALELWWESGGDWSGRDLERALWLRARLTVDPEMAALDYRRLVLEFPRGPYASRARHRLEQMAEAYGEGEAERDREVLFAIELGRTSSYARAARLFDEALRDGLNPRLVVLRSDRDRRYRVRVGRFSSRDAAERMERRLRRLDFDVRIADDAHEEAVARRR